MTPFDLIAIVTAAMIAGIVRHHRERRRQYREIMHQHAEQAATNNRAIRAMMRGAR